MSSQIYRFQVVAAQANGIFEARDESSHALVTLYEWTPDPDRREAARKRLETMRRDLRCEVFVADTRFYLVASSVPEAREALSTLRAGDLFTGVWFNEPSPPAVMAPPSWPGDGPTPAQAMLKPQEKARPKGWPPGVVIGFVLALLIAGVAMEESSRSRIGRLTDEIYGLRNEVADAGQSGRNEAAAANEKVNAMTEQMKPFSNVNLFRVTNACKFPARLATRSLAFDGQWIVQGWWLVQPGETTTMVASPSSEFFFYAYNPGQTGEWSDQKRQSPAIYLNDANFIYTESNAPDHTGQNPIHPEPHRPNGTEPMRLTCDQ